MGCTSCGSDGSAGCGNNGVCGTGGCNKMNTYDWISVLDIHDPSAFNMVEVSFKKGARKDFFINDPNTNAVTGDTVVVEAENGVDIGNISLSGELVRAQMKKKRVNEQSISRKVIRVAHHRDLEKLSEARTLEKPTLVQARVIARTLGLDMKIGDIEYQGDKRKATFYYTAEGRVDFRELVRSYAKEFKVKIEMRQIGARQESARIGGIGSCGRELCCSTWLSDFKTVTTTAARYQNIAINQAKLSGQCGRLKCCLNYELDSYMDALKAFPKKADKIHTKKGMATLIKTDIFKGLMFYIYTDSKLRGPMVALEVERVKEIIEMNKNDEKPADLMSLRAMEYIEEQKEAEVGFADVTGQIELPAEKKRRRNRNKRKGRNSKGGQKQGNSQNKKGGKPEKKGKPGGDKPEKKGERKSDNPQAKKKNIRNRNRNRNRNKGKQASDGQKNPNSNENKPTKNNDKKD